MRSDGNGGSGPWATTTPWSSGWPWAGSVPTWSGGSGWQTGWRSWTWPPAPATWPSPPPPNCYGCAGPAGSSDCATGPPAASPTWSAGLWPPALSHAGVPVAGREWGDGQHVRSLFARDGRPSSSNGRASASTGLDPGVRPPLGPPCRTGSRPRSQSPARAVPTMAVLTASGDAPSRPVDPVGEEIPERPDGVESASLVAGPVRPELLEPD